VVCFTPRPLYPQGKIHVFLTSVLVWSDWSASCFGRFTPGERASCTHWIGGWVGPRAGLRAAEKKRFLIMPGLELRPLGRPALSQSPYRLRYPGFHKISVLQFYIVYMSFNLHMVRIGGARSSVVGWGTMLQAGRSPVRVPDEVDFFNLPNSSRSRDSVVGIATSYGLDDRGVGVRIPVRSRIFSSPDRPDRLWGPPNLLSNGYRGLVPRG
jgi:hypothetical protein